MAPFTHDIDRHEGTYEPSHSGNIVETGEPRDAAKFHAFPDQDTDDGAVESHTNLEHLPDSSSLHTGSLPQRQSQKVQDPDGFHDGCDPTTSLEADTRITPPATPSLQLTSAARVDTSQHPLRLMGSQSLKRIGAIAFWTLILTSVAMSASLAFIGFLWFSDGDNPTWHWIVIDDHLITVVTGLSKAIETSIQLQLSLVSAMLAAILLENFDVALPHVAGVSLTRLSGGTLSMLVNLWRQTKHCARRQRGLHNWSVVILMFVAAFVLAFSQVVAIVLNRNIQLEALPGFNLTGTHLFSFKYDYNSTSAAIDPVPVSGNGWNTRLSSFPTYAEYTKPGVDNDGVSDTGECLRAFLPYASTADRQNLESYRGHATVVDTRVTCQIPQLLQAEVAAQEGALLLRGSIGASLQTPRLDNQTILPVGADNTSFAGWKYNELVPFECAVPTVANESDWRTALCQLPEGGSATSMWSGGLRSAFQKSGRLNLTDLYAALDTQNWGQAYIFLNATRGSDYDWRGALDGGLESQPYFSIPTYQARNEWTDLIFSDGSLILSVTLCYTSFATADFPIVVSSKTNRTEPTAPYDFTTARYNYDEVRLQMGQFGDKKSPSQRGILSLASQRQDWLALNTELPPSEPYIRQYFNMKSAGNEGEDANWTSILCEDTSTLTTTTPDAYLHVLLPDSSVISLFQQIVGNGGPVAFALQTLYTVMASNIYYSKLPEFDATSDFSRIDFSVVNAPTHSSGFYVVLGVVSVHFLLLASVLTLFLTQTSWTYLGEAWMTVAQTRGSVVENQVLSIMGDGVLTDDQISQILKKNGAGNQRVGLSKPSVQDEKPLEGGEREDESDDAERPALSSLPPEEAQIAVDKKECSKYQGPEIVEWRPLIKSSVSRG